MLDIIVLTNVYQKNVVN